MAAASEMVVAPLYPDPRRLRARSPPNPSAPRYYHRRPHPLYHRRRRHRRHHYRRCPESLSPQLPLPGTFFLSDCTPLSRPSRQGGRLGAFLSVDRKDLAKILPPRAFARARLENWEYARKREQPSSMLREYKYINTLHVYMYIALELPLAFIWPREIARTSR